jgi:hypothetical protein
MVIDAAEDIGEPCLGIHAVELRRRDQRVDRRRPLTAAIGTAERPAAAPERNTAQRSLRWIISRRRQFRRGRRHWCRLRRALVVVTVLINNRDVIDVDHAFDAEPGAGLIRQIAPNTRAFSSRFSSVARSSPCSQACSQEDGTASSAILVAFEPIPSSARYAIRRWLDRPMRSARRPPSGARCRNGGANCRQASADVVPISEPVARVNLGRRNEGLHNSSLAVLGPSKSADRADREPAKLGYSKSCSRSSPSPHRGVGRLGRIPVATWRLGLCESQKGTTAMFSYDAALFAAAEKWVIALDRTTKAEENGDGLSDTSPELKSAILALYDAIVTRRNSLIFN